MTLEDEKKDQAENSSEGLSTFLAEMAEHNEKIAEEAQEAPEEQKEGSAENNRRRLKKKEDRGDELAETG